MREDPRYGDDPGVGEREEGDHQDEEGGEVRLVSVGVRVRVSVSVRVRVRVKGQD